MSPIAFRFLAVCLLLASAAPARAAESEDVESGGSVKQGAREIGHGVKDAVHGLKKPFVEVGHGIKKGATEVGHGFRNGWHELTGKGGGNGGGSAVSDEKKNDAARAKDHPRDAEVER